MVWMNRRNEHPNGDALLSTHGRQILFVVCELNVEINKVQKTYPPGG